MKSPNRGFTIVELLVVVAIIASLVAFLMPALSRARAQALSVQCQSNLRQIGNALRAYANDFRDRYPDAYTTGNFGYRQRPGTVTGNDPFALPEVYGLAAILHGIEWNTDVTNGLPRAKYLPGNSDVWVCPAASPHLQQYGNTYSFSIASGLKDWTSIHRSRRQDNLIVWDNWTQWPGLTGFRGPFSGYNIPTNMRTRPHGPYKNGKGYVAELYLGGHVALKHL
jgi:prepilin-type N-terminal cleavage/methylation domain-containing protein